MLCVRCKTADLLHTEWLLLEAVTILLAERADLCSCHPAQ
jgi:hypothetical protein